MDLSYNFNIDIYSSKLFDYMALSSLTQDTPTIRLPP
jgi:hypothetical protein